MGERCGLGQSPGPQVVGSVPTRLVASRGPLTAAAGRDWRGRLVSPGALRWVEPLGRWFRLGSEQVNASPWNPSDGPSPNRAQLGELGELGKFAVESSSAPGT
ncbi:hypothetical protein P7K49_037720 [Saguinus oedipus]|uniref:Uncharacterized protein n=1 Tax=Saguinus oedipus TaxID=9490 RepID=A0ABQ9TIW8_SAGOE|nr:hypothetical protein P7K49_037720 [Saguinus oedipus]